MYFKVLSLVLQVFIFHGFAAVIGQYYEKVLLKKRKIELNGNWC